jgi:hypothetical protein
VGPQFRLPLENDQAGLRINVGDKRPVLQAAGFYLCDMVAAWAQIVAEKARSAIDFDSQAKYGRTIRVARFFERFSKKARLQANGIHQVSGRTDAFGMNATQKPEYRAA